MDRTRDEGVSEACHFKEGQRPKILGDKWCCAATCVKLKI